MCDFLLHTCGGEIPATEPNWKFLADPRFGNHNQWFPTFFEGPVIVHRHFTTSVRFGDSRIPEMTLRGVTCNVGEILGTRCPLLRLCPFTHRSRAGASAGWVKHDKEDRERDTESFGSTGGILVGIGEHVIQFAQLSGLGGFESFSSGGPFYIMTCPTGNEDGLFLFQSGWTS